MGRTLGDRIRELRNERDLSLRDLAKAVDVSAPFLTDVEKHRRYPKEETLQKLANALATTVEDLKAHDSRPPTKEISELADGDVEFAFAFRRIVDQVKSEGMSPDEMMRRITGGKPKQKGEEES